MLRPLIFQKFFVKNIQKIKNRLRLLIFQKFFIKNIQKIKNVLRPSFASLTLSTFPPGGRLELLLLFQIE